VPCVVSSHKLHQHRRVIPITVHDLSQGFAALPPRASITRVGLRVVRIATHVLLRTVLASALSRRLSPWLTPVMPNLRFQRFQPCVRIACARLYLPVVETFELSQLTSNGRYEPKAPS